MPKEVEIKQHPVLKTNCKNCGELLIKIYPNAIIISNAPLELGCIKCRNKRK